MKMKTFNQLSTDDSDPLQQPFVVVQNSRTVSMKMETFNEPSTVDNAPYDPPLPYWDKQGLATDATYVILSFSMYIK